ncbi:putative exopolygalacturonase C [Fulvia fulva]|uniref:galacturonan 1,4-alpha-galacturonidase n=1 Tax=Passalora fulva TaxID=5499 RepID=A0A9Q8LB73_PASFU|nr:putative exopolygalacturonase C [Fulvia fulva]KAK4631395.1 putative exopolygalacturonase C [Fulvia fulva]UJO14301.1 putative exopolygalacturonase C [Fulvia fulva]WPV11958.1 putative exopolygalacturonase C [Fulvia fulva]WPV25533.1 putative exopolygalacturonase C [Fulvia fulva]
MHNFLSASLLLTLAGTLTAAQCPASNTKKQTCRVESQYASSDGAADDSPAIQAAFDKCASNGIIAFNLGVDYNVLTPINASNLCDVDIHMYGNLNLPRNVTYVQELYNKTVGASDDNLHWFLFGGERVNYTGTANVTSGWIKSYGQEWWNLSAPNGTGTPGRPHLSYWNVTDLSINHLKHLKPIAWSHRLEGKNIHVQNSVIEAQTDQQTNESKMR